MNCQKFENVVGDLARGQMMEADVRLEALAHSDECEACLVRLRDEETLTRGLQLVAADMQTLAAPNEIELKLREAFRNRRVAASVATNGLRSRYWLAAVAAVLLVAMSVVAMLWRSDTPPQPTFVENTSPKPVEVKDDGTESPEIAPRLGEYRAVKEERKTSRPIRRNRPTRRAPESQMANHVTNEIATDFMPLGYMNPASLQDGGQIVRVTLRRSTLATFGIPVNMERYHENVKADVLVGVDGLARAIRFVQ